MEIILNPIVIAVVLLIVLCMLKINVLLSLLISAMAAGLLAGMSIGDTMSVLISGMGGNAQTALSLHRHNGDTFTEDFPCGRQKQAGINHFTDYYSMLLTESDTCSYRFHSYINTVTSSPYE